MRDVLLIGGMGAGKTTLARKLREEYPNFHYVYLGEDVILRPMRLQTSRYPDLLSKPKEEYIHIVVHEDADVSIAPSRQERNDFTERIHRVYGETINAEIARAVRRRDQPNIFDNIPKRVNVSYLKERGVYIVGLECRFETQVERRLRDGRELDPHDRKALEELVKRANHLFEVPEILELADVIHDTDNVKEEDMHGIARGIIERLQ